MKTIYSGKFQQLVITCKTHGDFTQEAWSHLKGRGCIECSGKRQLTNKEFIDKVSIIHNHKYDYSKTLYKSRRSIINIICNTHGDFQMTADHHLTGRGCPKCAGRYKTRDEFIIQAIAIHGNKYDYSKMVYETSIRKVNILCHKHGEFHMGKSQHIISKQGCPVCSDSKGAREIGIFLKEHKIEYIPEKRFDDCKYKKQLPFDFFIPSINTCIEYDGIQHYKIIDFFGGRKTFDAIKKSDLIKTNYCNENRICLERIKYTENVLERLKIIFKL